MPINDPGALLKRLAQEPNESAWLEFKHNNSSPDMIGQWASACANAAILAGKERAFIVFGVDNKSRALVGTNVNLVEMKKGGENFANWISRMIEPRLMMDFCDFKHEGKHFSIISIEATYDRPVRFSGTEYIRIGENVKKLSEFPEYERALWLATGRRKFESATALAHQSPEAVARLLDIDVYYKLLKEEVPKNQDEILRRLCGAGFIIDNMEGGFDITNLGAILFAKEISNFSSIESKSVRVVKYVGKDKSKSDDEVEGTKGYAVGFSGLIKFIVGKLPKEEKYTNGIRSMKSVYPEDAIREVIANALIHQDFTITGAGPVIEIYSDRLEVINPGNSLIDIDRIIDERRSRNEKLASTMRLLGLCEERGGGLDKAIIQIEQMNLPAPDFHASQNSMRVVLFGPRPFKELSKAEKIRACFFHCVLRWLMNDYMSNTTLRQRFSLADDDYQAVSAVISEAVELKRIVPAEPNQGRRNARYVPPWARTGAS